jgi:hypothetical protein
LALIFEAPDGASDLADGSLVEGKERGIESPSWESDAADVKATVWIDSVLALWLVRAIESPSGVSADDPGSSPSFERLMDFPIRDTVLRRPFKPLGMSLVAKKLFDRNAEGLLKTRAFRAGQNSIRRYNGLYICSLISRRHLVLLARHPLSIKGVFSAGHATKAFRDRA